MIRIVIATGIFPPDTGGPAYYAESLAKSFGAVSSVSVLPFTWEKKLPSGVRHIVYFFRLCKALFSADVVLALDTFTVGVPAVFAAKLMRKKIVIRTGGDFLWEQYVERTREKILLSEFYINSRKLSMKERTIRWLTGVILRAADCVVFSTEWQRKIFMAPYRLNHSHTEVVENSYPQKENTEKPLKKNFLWAGRDIFLKNKELLVEAFNDARKKRADIVLEILDGVPRKELFEHMESCYAVLLPSLSDISPNFLLEAVSFGKPFVSTVDTGLVGQIRECGIFINPRNKIELTNAILALSDDDVYAEYQKKINLFSSYRSYDDIASDFMVIFSTL